MNMKKACLGDYGVGVGDSDTCSKPPDYKQNILKMQVKLWGEKYLSDPERNKTLSNINGDPLNKDLNRLVELSRAARNNNIMNVIRYQSFSNFENYTLKVLENNEDKLSYNLESHIKVLIACEADMEKKPYFMIIGRIIVMMLALMNNYSLTVFYREIYLFNFTFSVIQYGSLDYFTL